MQYPPEHLAGATRRGHTTAPEGQRPAQCPDRGQPHSDMGIQPLENKALSWVAIRKSTCRLAEITIRKSQRIAFFVSITLTMVCPSRRAKSISAISEPMCTAV